MSKTNESAEKGESMKTFESHVAGPPGDTSKGQLCSRCGIELSYFGAKLGKTKPPLWPVGAEARNGAPCCGYWRGYSGLPNWVRAEMESHSVAILYVPPGSEEVEIPEECLGEGHPASPRGILAQTLWWS